MVAIRRLKTSFSAGELSDELLGRADLRAYENGARRLRNVFILPTGGVRRRPGLAHITTLPGPGRLAAFEFNTEQTYLLVLTDTLMTIFRGEQEIARIVTPWSEDRLAQLAWTQSADTMLIAHPDVPPQRLTRGPGESFALAPWRFVACPFFRFGDEEVTLAVTGTTGNVTVTASAPSFEPLHAGVEFRIGKKRLRITAVTSPTVASATILETLAGTAATRDWDEAALSPARGWPATLCFHQDRLVMGGSRDLPNRLWLSRTGDLFNFDLGTGLDDEAIEFALVSDQVNAIRAVFSGRHLQVFTSGAEWMVTGDPLTPGNIQLNRQTRIGSPVDRMVPPVDVDGATIYVSRTGRGVHEFAFADVEQAYQSSDLAVVARHLVERPVGMAYDQVSRLLHIVMGDGSLATLTLYRAEQVTAWTRQETQGAFRAVAEVEGIVYLLVERAGTTRLERFDPALAVDAAVTATWPTPRDAFAGLGHLLGLDVTVLADGAPRGIVPDSGGLVPLDPPARRAEAGLGFAHVIEPLPPELAGQYGARTGPVRLVAVTFRLLETAALTVDIGAGPRPVPFRRLGAGVLDKGPQRFTGDRTLRAIGWRRDVTQPLWRIIGESPLPLTLLSVTTEIRVND
jgi:hypothetical protein